MTEGGTAAQVPQEIARLARSHEEVSILFMDIVGEAGSVSHPYGKQFTAAAGSRRCNAAYDLTVPGIYLAK